MNSKNVLVLEIILIFFNLAILAWAEQCELPKNHGDCLFQPSSNHTSTNASEPEIRFYFDGKRQMCLTFVYAGCGGNQNNFLSKTECATSCKNVSGSPCSGDGLPFTNGTFGLEADSCEELECPNHYICIHEPGGRAVCCYNKTEIYFREAFTESCSDGRKAHMITDGYFHEPLLMDTCQASDGLCHEGFHCEEINQLFAKCCEIPKPKNETVPNTTSRESTTTTKPTTTEAPTTTEKESTTTTTKVEQKMIVRLIGPNKSFGIVELMRQGRWGRISATIWDEKFAKIVCKMLGFSGSNTIAYTAPNAGQSPVWVLSHRCTGTEAHISQCWNIQFHIWNRDHVNDLAVQCDFSKNRTAYAEADFSNKTIETSRRIMVVPFRLSYSAYPVYGHILTWMSQITLTVKFDSIPALTYLHVVHEFQSKYYPALAAKLNGEEFAVYHLEYFGGNVWDDVGVLPRHLLRTGYNEIKILNRGGYYMNFYIKSVRILIQSDDK